MAEKKTGNLNEKVEIVEEKTDDWNEKVEILVPRIPNSKEQPDLIASVNGRMFQVVRGQKVSVPKPIAEVIERSIAYEASAEDYYYQKAQVKEV